MPAAQSPLYIEMIGPSGVGKTTVLKLVAEELQGHTIFFRGGLKKRLLQNLASTTLSWKRLRRFVEFYLYLRREKSVPRQSALRRAAAITGMPASRSFIRAGNGALLVEEGPVGYLSSCGGWGEGWEEWTEVLLPTGEQVRAFFLVLAASPDELENRCNLRARVSEAPTSPTGKEGISAEVRDLAHQSWTRLLSAAGAHCLCIPTDGRSAADIAQEALQFIRSVEPGARPVDAEAGERS